MIAKVVLVIVALVVAAALARRLEARALSRYTLGVANCQNFARHNCQFYNRP